MAKSSPKSISIFRNYLSFFMPLGRIARDVICCFIVVLFIVKTQQSKKFQHYRRTIFGTGELYYNRYMLNVTVNNMKYRSILGEITGASIHRSSEAVILLASGQKGADALGDIWAYFQSFFYDGFCRFFSKFELLITWPKLSFSMERNRRYERYHFYRLPSNCLRSARYGHHNLRLRRAHPTTS